ncbi:MAG: DUF5829 family protein [Gemmatimonadales bacterium]
MSSRRVWILGQAVALMLSSGIADAQSGARLGVNHVYGYLDSTSYDALAASAFVRDTLGTVRQATVSDARSSWSGLYLFGRTTYLEFYRAGPATPPPGTFAIAFGGDEPGALDAARARLAGRGVAAAITSRRRPVGADTIPWFRQLSPGSADSAAIAPAARWWVMEYDEGYLARRPPGDPTLEGRVDRETYNRPLYRPELWLRDVAGLTLRLAPGPRAALLRQLEALGFERDRSGGAARFRTADIEIALEDAGTERAGLAEVRLAVAAAAPPIRRQLGGVRFASAGGVAYLRLP